jgi:hypothetical protein
LSVVTGTLVATNPPVLVVTTAASGAPLDGVTTTCTPASEPPRPLVTVPTTVPVDAGPVLVADE